MTATGFVELDTQTGWLGDNDTSIIAPYAEYSGDRKRASWFPDQAVARRWAQVISRGGSAHCSMTIESEQ